MKKIYIFKAMPRRLKVFGTIYESGALYQKCGRVRAYLERAPVKV